MLLLLTTGWCVCVCVLCFRSLTRFHPITTNFVWCFRSVALCLLCFLYFLWISGAWNVSIYTIIYTYQDKLCKCCYHRHIHIGCLLLTIMTTSFFIFILCRFLFFRLRTFFRTTQHPPLPRCLSSSLLVESLPFILSLFWISSLLLAFRMLLCYYYYYHQSYYRHVAWAFSPHPCL